jgi:hypothetical protein
MLESENMLATRHPKIHMLRGAACDLDLLNGLIQELALLTRMQDGPGIRKKLREMVPEYSPSSPSPIDPIAGGAI